MVWYSGGNVWLYWLWYYGLYLVWFLVVYLLLFNGWGGSVLGVMVFGRLLGGYCVLIGIIGGGGDVYWLGGYDGKNYRVLFLLGIVL